MQENNIYKYLSIVFAIIAIIFAILYFTQPTQPVSDTLSDTSENVRTCRDNIAAWQQAHMGQATTSAEDRADLEEILGDCKNAIESAQADL